MTRDLAANGVFSDYLLRYASVCATIALLIAPFRSSAGLRAGLLVVALLAVVWLWRVGRLAVPQRLTGQVFFFAAIGLWIAVVAAYSVAGAQPLESLASWRGDVLTPTLAGVVFFALSRTPRFVGAILLALLTGLLVLTAMIVIDPPQPFGTGHEPGYIGVGLFSTWLTMLAALLPLCVLIDWPHRRWAMAVGAIALVTILTAAWLTENRLVWVSFAMMLIIYAVLRFAADRRHLGRLAAVVVIGITASAALFYASAVHRHSLFPSAAPDAVTFMVRDLRAIIWREAVAVIAEKPLTGHGYALESSQQALAKRFTSRAHRDTIKQAHNIVLIYAIEVGLPGAAVLVFLFIALAAVFWVNRNRSTVAPAIAACGLMLVSGFVLRNMFDDFFSRHTMLLFGALVGLLLAMTQWPTGYFYRDRAADPAANCRRCNAA